MTLAKLEPATLNTTKLVAFLLVSIGIVVFAYESVRDKSRDYAIDLGPFHVMAEKSHVLPLPLIVGLCAFIGGIGTLVVSTKYTALPHARLKRGSRI